MTIMTPAGRGLGRIPDLGDVRDQPFQFAVGDRISYPLPTRIDLSQSFPAPPGDQGPIGSCTAWASLAAFRLTNHMRYGTDFDASELAQYYWSRVLAHTEEYDSGCTIRGAIKALAHFGACSELLWPYDPEKYLETPDVAAVSWASQHQVLSYQRVQQNLISIRRAVASGYAIVFGISVYESFESDGATATGNIQMPEESEDLLGGHALVICGYDDDYRRVKFRNSWSEEWGDGGYGTLPYDYVLNPSLASDFWVIRLVESPK